MFLEIKGQWRTDGGVRVSLDYTPIFNRMERLRLDDEAWESLFADLRVMESAALEQMADDADET